MELNSNLFANLTWKDEPIEVEIVSKKFMNMWRAKNNVIEGILKSEDSSKAPEGFEPIDVFNIM